MFYIAFEIGYSLHFGLSPPPKLFQNENAICRAIKMRAAFRLEMAWRTMPQGGKFDPKGGAGHRPFFTAVA
jgi:hypothetical protein